MPSTGSQEIHILGKPLNASLWLGAQELNIFLAITMKPRKAKLKRIWTRLLQNGKMPSELSDAIGVGNVKPKWENLLTVPFLLDIGWIEMLTAACLFLKKPLKP